MDLLHFLPYPPAVLQEGSEEDDGLFEQGHIQYWRSVLDKLSQGLIQWDLFLETYSGSLLSHPTSWLSTTEHKQTLLHLAVIDNVIKLIEKLANSPHLCQKKNAFGHTPLDTAQFLNRKRAAAILKGPPEPPFCDQPNVTFYDVKKNRSILSTEYLPWPIFQNYEMLKDVLFRTKKAKQEDDIPTEKVWMGIYYDTEVQKQQCPSIAIRYIDDEVGYGAFANQKIPSCAFVGEYTGIVEERRPRHLKDKYYCVRYSAWQMGKQKFVINAERMGNFTRFINHSDKPNLSLQSIYWKGMPRMIFIAIQEIAEGAQLTFDYGDIFWKDHSQIPRDFL